MCIRDRGIFVDALIQAAARALASGDPLAALGRVALRLSLIHIC